MKGFLVAFFTGVVLGFLEFEKSFQVGFNLTGLEKTLNIYSEEILGISQDFLKDFKPTSQDIPQGTCSELWKNQETIESPLLFLTLSEDPDEKSLKLCKNLNGLKFSSKTSKKDLLEVIKIFLSEALLKDFNIFSVIIKHPTHGRRLAECLNNINGCKICSNSNFCKEPLDGYYLNTKEGTVAGRCERGCKTCVNDKNCSLCFDGYFFSSYSCNVCPSNCLSCSSDFNCSICDFGFFLIKGSCKVCMEGCSLCANATHCGKALEGFFITSQGLTQECPEGCKSCQGLTCTVCKASFFLINSKCLPCSEGCSNCSSQTLCETCLSGNYLSSSSVCLPCSSNCLTCSEEECTSCRLKFFISTIGSCSNCIENCQTCENSITCEKCDAGFYYNKKKVGCMPCSSGCLLCQDENTCLQCPDLGFWNSSGTCKSCSNGCDICSSDSSGNCESCHLGYYLESGSCFSCPIRCKTCYRGNCTSCDEGFRVVQGKCQKCPYGCLSCESSECKSCKIGFYFDGKKCVMCELNCFSCSDENNCLLCDFGYYLDGKNCIRCSDGAFSCNGTEDFSCFHGYFLENTDCGLCGENCETCSSSSICLRCSPEYVLSDGACSPCTSSCTACPSSYYLYNDTCNKCSGNCLTCDSSSCSECQAGFWVNQGKCDLCGENCESCYNTSTCLICKHGYKLGSNGKCQSCTYSQCLCEDSYYSNASFSCNSCEYSCDKCNSTSSCQACISGYQLHSNMTCTSCPSNCKLCSGSTCLECNEGFILHDKICYQCNIHCKSCENLGACSICQNSFYLTSSFDCSPCVSNCKICNSDGCKQCYPGYYLDSSGLCQATIEKCLVYESSSNCTYCSNEFTSKNGDCYICQNIEITDSYFISNFSRIKIEFNKEINISVSYDWNCSECENIARPEGYYGFNCKCESEDNVLNIFMGLNFSMTSSSKILIITENLFTYICNDDQRVLVTYPRYFTLPSEPVPILEYQPVISYNCYSETVNFEVTSVRNSYAFDVSYIWLLTTSPSNVIAEGLAILEKSNLLSIQLSIFQNQDIELNITVTVRSMVSLSGTASAITNLTSKEYIAGRVDIESPKQLLFNKEYVITGKVVDACKDATVNFKWLIKGQNMTMFKSNLPHILYIPPYYLKPTSSNYTGTLTLSNSYNMQGLVNFTLIINYSPLVIIFNTLNSQIPSSKNYTLTAAGSYNPNIDDSNINNKKLKYDGMNFTWSYCKHAPGESCSLVEMVDQANKKEVTFNSSELNNSINYVFSVQLNLSSDGYPSASKTAELYISSSDTQIDLFPKKEKYEMVNFGELFESTIIFNSTNILTLKWEIEGPVTNDSKFIGINTPKLYVYRKSLEESHANYKITLNAYNSDNKRVAFAFFSFIKNIPPICSNELRVYPEKLGKSQIFYHNFIFAINNCVDNDEDYPLTYRFSLRICEYNCDEESIFNGSAINSAYYQLSIQKSFNRISSKVFHTSFNASVQICDGLKSCSTSTLGPIIAKEADSISSSKIIESYIENTKLYDMIPYYSIMYIKLFFNKISSDDYNYIYRLYSWYIRKQKIVNFDVAHICLSFINEQFKRTEGSKLKLRYIRQYLDESFRILKRNVDPITQQNADVFCEILNNVMYQISDDTSYMTLLELVLDYSDKFTTMFSNDRVVGDLILSKRSLTNSEIYMYKDTAKNMKNNLPEEMKNLLINVKSLDAEDIDIVVMFAISLKLNSKRFYYLSPGKSGSYNDTSLKYVMYYMIMISVDKNSLIVKIPSANKNDRCFGYHELNWVKDDYCSISSDQESISVSSSKITRVEDKNYFTVIPTKNLAPLGLSISLVALTLILVVYFWYQEKKYNEGKSDEYQKKRRRKALTFSTKEVILLNTLSLSFFSYNPNIYKVHKILQLALILNLQLMIDGGFFGWNVIKGKTITVVVGTGFIAPLITLPLNVLATYNIPYASTRLRRAFTISWIIMLILATVVISYINTSQALGKSSYWILSFAIGLSCEIFLEISVMFWKNMMNRHDFDQIESTI